MATIDLMNNFLDNVFEKLSKHKQFNMNKKQFWMAWENKQYEDTQSQPEMPTAMPTAMPINKELTSLSKKELECLCKAKGHKTTGIKQDLIDRLTSTSSTTSTSTSKSKSKSPPTSKSKTTETLKDPKIITSIQSSIQAVKIKKNSFGNFEHSETGFIFNKESQEVIGKQNQDGQVIPLTDNDIELCNKFKFKYVVPETINSVNNLNDIDDTEGEIFEEEEVFEEEEIFEEEEEIFEEEFEE